MEIMFIKQNEFNNLECSSYSSGKSLYSQHISGSPDLLDFAEVLLGSRKLYVASRPENVRVNRVDYLIIANSSAERKGL